MTVVFSKRHGWVYLLRVDVSDNRAPGARDVGELSSEANDRDSGFAMTAGSQLSSTVRGDGGFVAMAILDAESVA